MDANALISYTPNSVVTRQFLLNKGQHDSPHQHPWHQLLFPKNGTLRTHAANKHYFVPPKRAVLIPAGVRHESWAIINTAFVGIYFTPELLVDNITECRIIEMSALFRELALSIANNLQPLRKMSAPQQRLLMVFIDQLSIQQEVQIELVLPQDNRVRALVNQLCAQPATDTRLPQWAELAGASERTIGRIFIRETGLTFARWRNRLRLLNSLPMIEQQMPIKAVALNVGFNSAAAFIHSFKKEFGVTPKQYFS